jgi:hypothetical protein
MYAREPGLGVTSFIHLDDHYASNKRSHTQSIECRVNPCPVSFLLLAGSRLEDEDGLGQEEDAGRLGERMVGEEDDVVLEDCCLRGVSVVVSCAARRWERGDNTHPHKSCENPDTSLCEYGCASDEIILQALLWLLRSVTWTAEERLLFSSVVCLGDSCC